MPEPVILIVRNAFKESLNAVEVAHHIKMVGKNCMAKWKIAIFIISNY